MNKAGRNLGENGFTLLEIVIVVAVIALFIGLAVPRLPDISGTRIQQNARKISMILQLARNRAVSLRRYYRVEVDMESATLSVAYYGPEGTYIPDEDVRTLTLQEGVISDVVNAGDGKVLEGKGLVRISPRGFVEPSLIHIRDQQERTLTVVPSPASGRVSIREGYTELAVK